MSAFMKLVIAASGPSTVAKFREQCKNPMDTQEKLLLRYLRTNEDTRFGRDNRFNDLHSFRHYQEAIPIRKYEDFEPYIERSLHGEPEQLTAENPGFYATTSGTTGATKYIPVTPESRSAKSKLMRVWLSKLCLDRPDTLNSRVLTVVSPEAESFSPAGVPCGAESGHGYKNMPNALKASYSSPYEVYAIDDYETKYYTLLRIAASQAISFVYACNPSTVLLIAHRLGKFTEDIIKDVRDGGISGKYKLTYDFVLALKPYLKPNPARARFLEKAAAKAGGVLLPKHVWPEVASICCWKGGSVGMYVKRFDQYYRKGTPVRDIGYFSSEFRGSVPFDDGGSAGVLAVPTNVYEFFPAGEDRGPERTELLTTDELEEGKQYYVYVTTSAGLCRYDMNDIIEVTGYYEGTPCIRFVQKGKGFVSFTGEKLYENQVVASVADAFQSFEGNYEFIAAIGEICDNMPRFAFLTEFEKPIHEQQAKELAVRLEQSLCKINIEYASKRKSGRINPLVLRVVKAGEFDRYRKREVQSGKKDGQFKILKLTQDEFFAGNFEADKEYAAVELQADATK